MYELFGFELADFKELFYVFCTGSACLPLHHCRAKIPALWNPKQNKPQA